MSEHEIDKAVGQYLKETREAQHLSRWTLARRCGLKEYRLNTLERGTCKRGITLQECEAIAYGLRIDPQDLVKRALGEIRPCLT